MATEQDSVVMGQARAAAAFVLGVLPETLSGFIVVGMVPGEEMIVVSDVDCQVHLIDALAVAISRTADQLPCQGSTRA